MAKEFDIPSAIEKLEASLNEEEKLRNFPRYMDIINLVAFLKNKSFWVNEYRTHTASMSGATNTDSEAEQSFWNTANRLLDEFKEENRYKK